MRLLPLLLSLLFYGCGDETPKDSNPVESSPPEGVDADGDGYFEGNDCDDSRADVSPVSPEVCDGVDNNCDEATDEGLMETLYADLDGDGYGNAASSTSSCSDPAGYVADSTDCNDGTAEVHPGADESDCTDSVDYNCDNSVAYADIDGDGFAACEDCDDADAARNPDVLEVCDEAGIDENCNGLVNGGDSTIDASSMYSLWEDLDGDGFGDPDSGFLSCTEEAEGAVDNDEDCDDADAAFNPDATEACDGTVDYDCDGRVNFYDGDGDGSASCLDCNDADAAISPAGVEVCDGIDNNCNGTVDDSAVDAPLVYADVDYDGYGSDSQYGYFCLDSLPGNAVSIGGDCDDTSAAVNPDATEVCDGVDNDCDGTADTGAVDATLYYIDADYDGHGSPSFSDYLCTAPTSGGSLTADDCDDTNPSIGPDAFEHCDGVDEDCDGSVDESPIDQTTWYPDADADGYGVSGTTVRSCDAPANYAATFDDCNDADTAINPGATEYCDSVDNDCNGAVDDGAVAVDWYPDADADGFGDAGAPLSSCAQPSGYIADGSDCDDTDVEVYPGATEHCDGEDDDCDGFIDDEGVDPHEWFDDADGDGYAGTGGPITCEPPVGASATSEDCDDLDPSISPDAAESCGDGVDNDCDGVIDEGC